MLGSVIRYIKDQTALTLCSQIRERLDKTKRIRPKLKHDDWIRASSIPYMCPREEAYYSLTPDYAHERLDPLRIIFEFGNAFQEIIRDKYLAPQGILIGEWKCAECSQPFPSREYIRMPYSECSFCGSKEWRYQESFLENETYRINGHPDGFLSRGHKHQILEIKTANENSYEKFSTKKLNAPMMKQYFIQVQFYMWLAGYKETNFLFFNKNGRDMCEFTVGYNHLHIEMYLEKILSFRNAVREGVLPECTCVRKGHNKLQL